MSDSEQEYRLQAEEWAERCSREHYEAWLGNPEAAREMEQGYDRDDDRSAA